MCGISGFNFHTDNNSIFTVTAHRGPNATQHGRYGKFTLGHNRLSIIDLSETANQPFVSADGNFVIVFNGEVYNFQELRKKLEGKYAFRTNSDTEVVLNSYIEYGEDCVQKFNGMFAFAIYNIQHDTLFCARDRMGIKPLVYYWENGTFIFGSEIKVILAALGKTPALNHDAMSQYLRYLYVPCPETIFSTIHKLPPAHTLTFSKNQLSVKCYWDVSDFIGTKNNWSEEQALHELEFLLDDAVKLQMISDVELGSFLSGGIDSSTILYYMAKNSEKPINTFTLGFADAPRYDERSDARLLSEHLGTNHREIMIAPDAAGLLSKMVHHFDEPFGNPTSLLIHELAKATKEYATVALAGDGGDEIFGGYPRYEGCMLYEKFKWIPKPLLKILGGVASFVPESSTGNHTLRRAKVFIHSLNKPIDEMYEDWIGYFSPKELNQLIKIYKGYGAVVKDTFNAVPSKDLMIQSSVTDIKTFLPNNLLSYSDAMSMANSFEVRVPLIDHRLVELMTGLPSGYRIKNGTTKYLLKTLLKGKVPDQIINKPKLGLNPPMGIWLKKDLQPLVKQYLSKETIEKRGILNFELVQQILQENERGKKDRSLYIWSLIVLEEWFRQYMD